MRVLLTPAGSRGDFQPLLALAVGLQAAGHQVVLAASACFRDECAAFEVPFVQAGVDVRQFLREQSQRSFTPLRATLELVRVGRAEAASFIRELLEPCRAADVVIGGGAQIAAPTAAEAAGKPYWYVAYTPQIIPSAHHPPFTFPFMGLPRLGNRALWGLSRTMASLALGGPINQVRRELGLSACEDLNEHVFPRDRCVLACDPELTPPPPDLGLRFPPIGSLHLDDARPLEDDVERFLQAGRPPVYFGFGSMPDPDPAATTRLILEAVERSGCRALISSGWAGLGAMPMPDRVKVVGPASHRVLFPRVAAVVHHGGAGTTAAGARAGKPQLVVHHAFDQIGLGRQVERAGVGPRSIARAALTPKNLAGALGHLLERAELATKAHSLGETLRGRDPTRTFLGLLGHLAAPPTVSIQGQALVQGA